MQKRKKENELVLQISCMLFNRKLLENKHWVKKVFFIYIYLYMKKYYLAL